MAAVERDVAFDVHKHSLLVAAIAAAQQVVLAPRRMSRERFAHWAPDQLTR